MCTHTHTHTHRGLWSQRGATLPTGSHQPTKLRDRIHSDLFPGWCREVAVGSSGARLLISSPHTDRKTGRHANTRLKHIKYRLCVFITLCVNGTTLLPFTPYLWLAPDHPCLGVLASASPWCPFPPPCTWCSMVYISSPRHGAQAPRDMIVSLVLSHGALHEELGVGGGRWPKQCIHM
uniref:Uncharacterized protein n=1 Tax=Castor canadensis TaxID=51338 RepID=A0A8C0X183_CASCN